MFYDSLVRQELYSSSKSTEDAEAKMSPKAKARSVGSVEKSSAVFKLRSQVSVGTRSESDDDDEDNR